VPSADANTLSIYSVFIQNGPQDPTGALFLAVSQEENVSQGHTISPDGYNIGRDLLVANALGDSSFGGVDYHTVGKNITGLLPVGSQGVNHGEYLSHMLGIYFVLPVRESEGRRNVVCVQKRSSVQCADAADGMNADGWCVATLIIMCLRPSRLSSVNSLFIYEIHRNLSHWLKLSTQGLHWTELLLY
jgi:hypothetical protein